MNDKENAIAEAIKQMNKKYGPSAAIKLGDGDMEVKVETISSGSLILDRIFACGGLPRGRVIELFGEQSSGKSTLAGFIVAQIQAQGGKAAWVDAEFSFSSDYAEKIGIDINELIISQPQCAEEALEFVEKMVQTHAIDLIVIDSVAALVPRKELEGDIGDPTIALQARFMSQALRRLIAQVSSTNTSVIFINQIRDKVGVFWGSASTTSGGKALKFYASVRLKVKKGKDLKQGTDVIGNLMDICAVKNKVGVPWRIGTLTILYKEGIDLIQETIALGVETKVIKIKGNTYYYGDNEQDQIKIGVGEGKAEEFLRNSHDVYEEIRKKIRAIYVI